MGKGKEKEVTILGHLDELRRRIMLCVIVLFLTISMSFWLAGYVIRLLKNRAPGAELIYTKPTEMIGVYIQVSLYLGVGLALPFIIYQVFKFVSPGLKSNEKRYIYTLLPAVIFFFAGGVAFSYFILLPPGLHFLLTFGSDIAKPMISVGSYVGLLTTLMFWTGVIFEIPIVMYFLSKIGIVTPAWFAKKRKWAFVGAFVIAALVTPTTDPINQTLLALPMVGLYELGILGAKLARMKGKPKLVAKQVPYSGT